METEISQKQNPALKPIEILIGNWNMELSNASFLSNSSDTVTGKVSFEWVEGGAFPVMFMGGSSWDTADAIWLISRDESVSSYTVLYYDTRHISRVYEMSFSDGIWKLWRNSPNFSQRFEGTFNKTSNRIVAHWEKSRDGSTWEHDFDVVYTRTG